MITEDYVSFEIAKLLKEKGFNERLLTFYVTDEAKKEGSFQLMAFTDDKIDNNYSDYCYLAPTLQMTMKWLREVHKIVISIFPTIETDMIVREDYNYTIYKNRTAIYQNCSLTYEEACDSAIKYCLEKLI